jgi:hypothetical protein
MQEHLMRVHGYTQADIRANTRRQVERGYIFTLPDGKDWLSATRVLE